MVVVLIRHDRTDCKGRYPKKELTVRHAGMAETLDTNLHSANTKHRNHRILLAGRDLYRSHHEECEDNNGKICEDIDRSETDSKGVLIDAGLRPQHPRRWKFALEGKGQNACNHPRRDDAEKAVTSS